MSMATPDLQELLDRADSGQKRLLKLDKEVGRLKSKLSGLESEVPDPRSVSVDDESAMMKLAARSQAISLLPVQIEDLELQLDNAIDELLDTVEPVRVAIGELAAAEQRRIVKEISVKLRPYCVPRMEETQPGKMETVDPAISLAWRTTIISSISLSATTEPSPKNQTYNGYSEEGRRNTRKADAMKHADEVLGVAREFLNNGASFVSRNVFKDFKS